jgi:hypothetical protein
VPEYFYTPRDNLLKSLTKKKTEPLEPKFFVLTEPDDRVSRHLFNTMQSFAADSIVSAGTIREGKNY